MESPAPIALPIPGRASAHLALGYRRAAFWKARAAREALAEWEGVYPPAEGKEADHAAISALLEKSR